MATRFWLIFLTFLFPATDGRAQNMDHDVKIESVLKANENYTSQDLKKLKMLNQLAKGYAQTDSEKGAQAAEQAYALAQSLNNELERAAAIHFKALNLASRGDVKTAIPLYEEALSVNQEHRNLFGQSENLYELGMCYNKIPDTGKAREFFEKSAMISEQIRNNNTLAKTYEELGKIYKNIPDPATALTFYQKALNIYEQSGNKKAAGSNWTQLGYLNRTLSNFDKAISCFQNSLKLMEQLGDKEEVAKSLVDLGSTYYQMANFPLALEYFQKSLKIQEESGNKRGMAIALGNMGSVYNSVDNHEKAIDHFQRALKLNEEVNNKNGIASNLGNLGLTSMAMRKDSIAVEYYLRALKINEELGRKTGIAINLINLGLVYENLHNYSKAMEYNLKALKFNEELGQKHSAATSLYGIASVILNAPDSLFPVFGIPLDQRFEKVIEYLDRSQALALETGDLARLKNVWNIYSIAYEKQGNYQKAFEAYKEYSTLRDSIEGEEVKNNITRKEIQFEFTRKEDSLKFAQQLLENQLDRQRLLNKDQEQTLLLREKELTLSNKEKDIQRLAYLKEQAERQEKEKQLSLSEKERELQSAELKTRQREIEVKNAQRNLFFGGTVLMLLLAASIFVGLKRTAREKKRSDELLLNILPAEVAEELKAKGEAEAKMIEEVTVLFTDFRGFTEIAETLSPGYLVKYLNECFTAFDQITQKYELEKIKTIGDSYMAAGGLPSPNTTHAADAINAALEMRDFIDKGKIKRQEEGSPYFEIRIGIHTGPVVAGIVGVKKFQYDIWGDTVNMASRMETSCEVGKVNISETTYELVKDQFSFVHRGKVTAKNKGETDMYFVEKKLGATADR